LRPRFATSLSGSSVGNPAPRSALSPEFALVMTKRVRRISYACDRHRRIWWC
jgi:hypothetical protein